jgi:two-component system phosphate regulon response regulator PhoB
LLVVDDDAAVRKMLTLLLEAEGYVVRQAPEGSVALSLIEAGQLDLLLVDLEMPGMGGLELLRRVSDLAVVPPSIVISGQRDGRRLALGAGAAEFVAKPFDVDGLLSVVASVLKQHPRARSDRAPLPTVDELPKDLSAFGLGAL